MTSRDDRRRHVRHAMGTSIRLFMGKEEAEQAAEVVDLSGGGIRVKTRELDVEPDMPLSVYIALPDGRGAMTVARVVRSDEDGVALRFDAIDNAEGGRLDEPDLWISAEEVYVVPIASQARSAIRELRALAAL